jgi:hypothetical protein
LATSEGVQLFRFLPRKTASSGNLKRLKKERTNTMQKLIATCALGLALATSVASAVAQSTPDCCKDGTAPCCIKGGKCCPGNGAHAPVK